MDHISSYLDGRPVQLPQLRDITLDHPWRWIRAGWHDYRATPIISLSYGLLFVLSSMFIVGLTYRTGFFFYIPALLAGFFLLSPVMAFGLYGVSKQLGAGESPDLWSTLTLWRSNPFNLLSLGLILLMAFLVWMMVANMVFAIFYYGITPSFENFIPELFFSGNSPVFVMAGLISGSVIAFAVFCITVISVPMLVDREIDVFSAVVTSVRAVMQNPLPLLLWGGLITAMIMLGFLTFGIGLIVAMPLVGYASWHAYRDLVVHEK